MIMIVDDNDQNLVLLETIVKTIGHDVVAAKNGAEALELAQKNPPELIITDILMPVMDGFELCRRWKADDVLSHVPFVFFTATYVEPKDEQFALGLGADRFIIKPQDPDVLIRVIQDVLENHHDDVLVAGEKSLEEEMEVLRDYNEVLFNKLQQKMLQLENMARFPEENPNPVIRVAINGKILFANGGSDRVLKSWQCTIGNHVPPLVKNEIDASWFSNLPRECEIQVDDRVYSFMLVPIKNHVYMNLYGRDITDLKKAQQSLLRLNTELEARVEDRTRSLNEARERFMRQENLAMIGKLARIVAHELRNPLSVITNSIYYLNMKIPSPSEKIQKHLALIQENSKWASKIISDLIDFSHTHVDELEIVDVRDVLHEALSTIPVPDDIDVKTWFDENMPRIKTTPRKLHQAFTILIMNAFQAMSEGGILEITVSVAGEFLSISFKDNGVGIPDDNLPKIFEPLFSTRELRTGLGLFFIKEIVNSIDGNIDVESEIGSGSTFIIRIPVPAPLAMESEVQPD